MIDPEKLTKEQLEKLELEWIELIEEDRFEFVESSFGNVLNSPIGLDNIDDTI